MNIKINKKRVAIQFAKYGTMVGLGYLLGKNIQRQIFNNRLNYMARSGATISNIVDGKLYRCSVNEIID